MDNPTIRQSTSKESLSSLRAFSLLFLFCIYTTFFFVFLKLLPVLKENHRIQDLIPELPAENILVVLYLIGLVILLGITILIPSWKSSVQLLMILFMLTAGIYLNRFNRLYNNQVNFQPYLAIQGNSLSNLAKERWKRELPFSFMMQVRDIYYLMSVSANTELPNYNELRRLGRFGISWINTDSVPAEISKNDFQKIERSSSGAYIEVQEGNYTYRFYPASAQDQEILVTSFQDLIIFIPKEGLDD